MLIFLYVAFCKIMAISPQKKARRRDTPYLYLEWLEGFCNMGENNAKLHNLNHFYLTVCTENKSFISFILINIPSTNVWHTFSVWTVFIRHSLTSIDVRFWRLKTVPELKELNKISWYTGILSRVISAIHPKPLCHILIYLNIYQNLLFPWINDIKNNLLHIEWFFTIFTGWYFSFIVRCHLHVNEKSDLSLTTLEYYCINLGDQRVFSISKSS